MRQKKRVRKRSERRMGACRIRNSKSGMEMVQVAILIAIAVVLGLIFKTEITDFVNKTFEGLDKGF